jgi:hypothetical protein
VPTVAVLSFRLGWPDGATVVAESWRRALSELADPAVGAADVEHNRAVACTHFAHGAMREGLAKLLAGMGVTP